MPKSGKKRQVDMSTTKRKKTMPKKFATSQKMYNKASKQVNKNQTKLMPTSSKSTTKRKW